MTNVSFDNENIDNSLNPSTSANSLSTNVESKKEKSIISWLKHFRTHKHKRNENQKEKKKSRLNWNIKHKIAVVN